MEKLSYTLNNEQHFSSNSYIKIDRIKNIQDLESILAMSHFSTSIDDKEEFLNRLEDFELKSSSSNGNHIFGVVVTFMLDKDHSDETIKKILQKIVENFNNLPYVSFITKEGEGTYLNVYFCERHYYPEGLLVEKKAKKNLYKSSITHSFCRQDDENAELFCAEGEVVSTKTVYFSTKENFFRYERDAFVMKWNALREWFMNILKELTNMEIIDGVSFKQFVVKELPRSMKNSAKVWNVCFREMSDKLNSALSGLKYLDIYNNSTCNMIGNLFNTFNDLIKSGAFNYRSSKNKSVEIKISPGRSINKTKQSIECLLDTFTRALNSLMSSIINNDSLSFGL